MKGNLMKTITKNDIEQILGMKVPHFVSSDMEKNPLQYEDLTPEQLEKYLIHVVKVLLADITRCGEHRLVEWEEGWNQNLQEFCNTKNPSSLIPKYHGKNRYVRWMGKIVNPITHHFDYRIHTYMVDTVLNSYMEGIENVYEFGCGPAYHLLRMQNNYPDKCLHGLDWTSSSQDIIGKINSSVGTDIKCHRFNFFEPDRQFDLKPNSMAYTIAALEQVGDRFVDFVEYLIEKKPKVCIHMEPMSELLDENSVVDFLSIEYFKKRNYLSGFHSHLLQLEKEGRIEIISSKRTYSGSYFIEGHSLVVWKPKD